MEKTPEQIAQEQEAQAAADTNAASKVELDPETYNALLDRLAELEARDQLPMRRAYADDSGDDIDALAREGRRRSEARSEAPAVPEGDIDYDSLTNKQMIDLIVNAINRGEPAKRLERLELSLQEVRVENELTQCINKHKDFMLYANEVKKLGMENPTLSLEKAYKLAKADDPERAIRLEKRDDKGGPKQTTTEKLLRLPPRHSVHGEKPGVSPAATQESASVKGESLKGSATRAWDAVMGQKQEV